MRELRKIQKAIEEYQILLKTDTQNAKQNCIEYLEDVTSIEGFINYFIEDASKELERWCHISAGNFLNQSTNIFLKVKRWINMSIINHYLNKISRELAIAGKCQESLIPLKERFVQFKYLTN